MTVFTFNSNIPAANDDPADDQPIMLQNNSSNAGIWNEDHIGFNATNGGCHKKITFDDNYVPTTPSGNISVLYTDNGVADNASPQVYWKNEDVTLPAMPVKAFGVYTISGTSVTSVNNFNIDTLTRTSMGEYAVVLKSGSVSSTTFGILITTFGANRTSSYTVTGSGAFTLSFREAQQEIPRDPSGFTFAVLQV